jgi:hypothetical protein
MLCRTLINFNPPSGGINKTKENKRAVPQGMALLLMKNAK